MKTQIHNNSDLKLHELNNKILEKIHSNELGLKVPENYFANSKKEILKEILKENKPKVIPIYRQKKVWFIAASVLLLFGLTFFNTFSNLEFNNNSIVNVDTINQLNKELKKDVASTDGEQPKKDDFILNEKTINTKNTQSLNIKQIENDVLVKSLFIEDHEINEYVTNYMLEDI